MYERILVGTDGSPTATNAVEAAALTAVAHGAELTIAYAFEATRTQWRVAAEAEVPDELRWRLSPGAMAESLVVTAVDEARVASGGRVTVHGRCEPGRPVPVLLGLVDELAVDAVVVGNRDVRGWWRAHRSVAHTLSRRAQCDVLIVDTAARTRSPRWTFATGWYDPAAKGGLG